MKRTARLFSGPWAKVARVVLALIVIAAIAGCGGSPNAERRDAAGDSGAGSQGPSGVSSPTSASNGAAEDSGPLVIASWGGHFSQATQEYLVKPFMQETGIEVQIVDAPGKQVANLQAQERAGKFQWDLLDSVTAADAFVLADLGLLAELPPNLKAKLESELQEGAVESFGFTFSNLAYVIACNMDVMESCPDNQADFFDPSKFPQAREMIATFPLLNLTFASMAGGVQPQDTATSPIDLDLAFSKLEEIKPQVKLWWESGDQMEQALRTGEVDMGIVYSGRAFGLIDTGMNLQVNWSGGIYNPGYWAVVAGSQHKDAAFRFLEWVATHPEAQAKWAEATGYSVPHPKAFDYLDEKTKTRLADYPDNYKQLARLNYDWYVEHQEEVNKKWREFLQGS